MDAKQFAWLYLVENGKAEMKSEFYGGFKFTEKAKKLNIKGLNDYDHRSQVKVKDFYLHQIKTYGVNWDRTEAPHSDMVRKFNGTLAELDEEEFLEGTLVLTNGSTQLWISEALGVTNVFEMMASVSKAEEKFKKVF